MSDCIISVVVPVYNVAPYLTDCVDSIIHQSFESFELILVDDGSTDDCGRLCDDYARRDARIRVIHRENGGLSAARNTGTSVAEGKYTAYIDSDDMVERNYLETLYGLVKKYDAQVAVCRYRYMYGNHIEDADGRDDEFVYSKVDALKTLFMEREFGHFAHQKLVLTEIARRHQFPVGKIYEDIPTMYKMIADAERTAYSQQQLYIYRQRVGSIVSTRKAYRPDVLDHIDSVQGDIRVRFPEVYPYTEQLKAFYYLHAFARIPVKPSTPGERETDRRVCDYIKANRLKLWASPYISKRVKGQLVLSLAGKRLYQNVWKLRETRKLRLMSDGD